MIQVYTRRDTPTHEHFLDAFLDWGGYVVVNDRLIELLLADAVGLEAFIWRARYVPHVSAA